MDVLLCGAKNGLMETLIDKLRKEGHRIFVLTNERNKKTKYSRIFEQYNFLYENPNMGEIIESISPEGVIFLGAYDASFDWSRGESETSRYMAGLANILTACTRLKALPRFLYLSNHEVFNESCEKNIREHDKFSLSGVKSIAVRQGELLCGNYYKSFLSESVVCRLDHLYGAPMLESDIDDPLRKLLRDGIFDKQLRPMEGNIHSLLHIEDAVDYLYQILICEEPEHRVYNLTSSIPISEEKIAIYLARGLGDGVELSMERDKDRKKNEVRRIVLDNTRFCKEFRGKVFHKYDEELPALAQEAVKNKKKLFASEYRDVEKPISRARQYIKDITKVLLPYVETAIIFIPAFMLNNRATDSEYFAKLDFYLLYVIIMALIHGQQQAMMAGVLATIGYLFRQQYSRSTFDVMLDYNTYVWIAQIFIIGLVVGNIKDRLKIVRDEDEHEMDFLSTQLEDITDINNNNVVIKKNYEEQLINQHDSFGKVYEITSTLDQYAPEEVLFYAAEVLRQLLRTDDVAIYTVGDGEYARLFAATSKQARCLGTSIRYKEMTEMYVYLNTDQVYINRELQEDKPQMANGISEEGKMQLIFMVWGLPMERMNLSQANMMRVAGYLIQNAVLRANRYMDAIENTRHIEGSQLLDALAFNSLLRSFLSARNRGLTECCVLQIQEIAADKIFDAAKELSSVLRESDYLGEGRDDRLYVLLGNTDEKNSHFAIDRLKKAGYESHLWEGTIYE